MSTDANQNKKSDQINDEAGQLDNDGFPEFDLTDPLSEEIVTKDPDESYIEFPDTEEENLNNERVFLDKEEEENLNLGEEIPPKSDDGPSITMIVISSLIAIVCGFMFYTWIQSPVEQEDETDLTSIYNRLDSLDTSVDNINNRVGNYSFDDNESISDKLSTLNANQQALEVIAISTSEGVSSNEKRLSTVTKKLTNVSNVAYSNKKGLKKLNTTVTSLSSKVRSIDYKVKAKDSRIKTLQSLVDQLKKEECTTTFRMHDTDLCK